MANKWETSICLKALLRGTEASRAFPTVAVLFCTQRNSFYFFFNLRQSNFTLLVALIVSESELSNPGSHLFLPIPWSSHDWACWILPGKVLCVCKIHIFLQGLVQWFSGLLCCISQCMNFTVNLHSMHRFCTEVNYTPGQSNNDISEGGKKKRKKTKKETQLSTL